MIKAVMFDLGGVLTLNRDDHKRPKENLKVNPETWHKAGLGLIDDEVAFEEMAKNHQVDSQTVKEWLFSKRKPNLEVFELLSKFKPEIKKAIVSNSLKSIFHQFMDQYQLKDKFDVVIVSAEEQVKKPDPEIFLRAYQRLGVDPSECLFVDNDQGHIEAAEKLGMQGILFINPNDLKDKLVKLNIV
ncbi:MAG: HAD-IA family hydrolase [Patescibacteria group bacterium]|nr:HAD-IA family hydrolase [Patescibacteria group bacterium]